MDQSHWNEKDEKGRKVRRERERDREFHISKQTDRKSKQKNWL